MHGQGNRVYPRQGHEADGIGRETVGVEMQLRERARWHGGDARDDLLDRVGAHRRFAARKRYSVQPCATRTYPVDDPEQLVDVEITLGVMSGIAAKGARGIASVCDLDEKVDKRARPVGRNARDRTSVAPQVYLLAKELHQELRRDLRSSIKDFFKTKLWKCRRPAMRL